MRIDPPTVSGRDARVEVSGEEIVLTDVGSQNGTFVNGRKVTRAVVSPTGRVSPETSVSIHKDGVAARQGDAEAVRAQPA